MAGLSRARLRAVQRGLEQLYAQTDFEERRRHDPVAAAHRYTQPRDQEIAGLFAASFAYGRVDLFRPVTHRVMDWCDTRGGPHEAVMTLQPWQALEELGDLVYRFNRGVDVVLMMASLRELLREHGSLGAVCVGPRSRVALAKLVVSLRQSAVSVAPQLGLRAQSFQELPRGFRYWLNHPEQGSACKRLNMYLRWMVRPATEGLDLGIWKGLTPAGLVIPLDVHVQRISGFLGLCSRKTSSWRAAEEITGWLRKMDPVDPVRYDFAIAHLGISGACKGHADPTRCPSCALEPVCRAPRKE